MSLMNRLLYTFALTVLLTMIVGLLAMIFEINIVPWLLSGAIVVPLAIVSYMVAPFLGRYVKRDHG